jgi:hypothetical protein
MSPLPHPNSGYPPLKGLGYAGCKPEQGSLPKRSGLRPAWDSRIKHIVTEHSEFITRPIYSLGHRDQCADHTLHNLAKANDPRPDTWPQGPPRLVKYIHLQFSSHVSTPFTGVSSTWPHSLAQTLWIVAMLWAGVGQERVSTCPGGSELDREWITH